MENFFRRKAQGLFPGRVRVYTETEDGAMVYLGKCRIYKVCSGYEVRIPESMHRLSVTGRFLLRPSALLALRHRGAAVRIRLHGRERVCAIQLMIAIDGKI